MGALMKSERKIGNYLNWALGYVGLQLCRKSALDRHTIRGSLEHAKRLGLDPKTVIDVGVGTGTFELYDSFPDARHILIEPLEEYKPVLLKIVSRMKNAEYIIAAAADKSGNLTINVHRDLVGSSLYMEYEGRDVDGLQRTVSSITLDELYKERRLEGPCLIKVDVQGAELDVLAGAILILKETDYVVLEVSLMGFFIGGPQIYDVVKFMKERGFVVSDILDYAYRPLDNSMSQVDMAFVKESGRFRTDHSFATKLQREVSHTRPTGGKKHSQVAHQFRQRQL